MGRRGGGENGIQGKSGRRGKEGREWDRGKESERKGRVERKGEKGKREGECEEGKGGKVRKRGGGEGMLSRGSTIFICGDYLPLANVKRLQCTMFLARPRRTILGTGRGGFKILVSQILYIFFRGQ